MTIHAFIETTMPNVSVHVVMNSELYVPGASHDYYAARAYRLVQPSGIPLDVLGGVCFYCDQAQTKLYSPWNPNVYA